MLVSRPTYTSRYTFTPCVIFYFYVEGPTYVSVSSDIHFTLTNKIRIEMFNALINLFVLLCKLYIIWPSYILFDRPTEPEQVGLSLRDEIKW